MVSCLFAGYDFVFVSHIDIFVRAKWGNLVYEGCFKKCHKIVQKTVMKDYFLSKVPDHVLTEKGLGVQMGPSYA